MEALRLESPEAPPVSGCAGSALRDVRYDLTLSIDGLELKQSTDFV